MRKTLLTRSQQLENLKKQLLDLQECNKDFQIIYGSNSWEEAMIGKEHMLEGKIARLENELKILCTKNY